GSSQGAIRGDPTIETGYQANPYRSVLLGGAPNRELEPLQRIRQTLAASLHFILPTGVKWIPYLALRPSYRFYWDDWGVLAHSPELRTYVPFGPFELRVTGRYYTQSAASFWPTDGVGRSLETPN